jgi:hypothetical protein
MATDAALRPALQALFDAIGDCWRSSSDAAPPLTSLRRRYIREGARGN